MSPSNGRSFPGRTLKALRDESGLSQGQLAELAGCNRSTISAWEKGIRELREDTKSKILDILGLEAKAWQDAERFLRQMDWWRERYRVWSGVAAKRMAADAPAGESTNGGAPPGSADIGHEIARIAEAEARDRERQVTENLELLCRLLLETRR